MSVTVTENFNPNNLFSHVRYQLQYETYLSLHFNRGQVDRKVGSLYDRVQDANTLFCWNRCGQRGRAFLRGPRHLVIGNLTRFYILHVYMIVNIIFVIHIAIFYVYSFIENLTHSISLQVCKYYFLLCTLQFLVMIIFFQTLKPNIVVEKTKKLHVGIFFKCN